MTPDAAAPGPGPVAVWGLAIRPATLPAAAAPVLVGTACAFHAGGFALGPAVACLLGALFIQIGTNFANDVFDYEKGADGADRIGPTRAVAAGLVSPRAMKVATAVAFGLATVCGVYLTAVAGWGVVAIGVASILSGLAYTGGPYPLAYHGLGDVFVLVFFGFVAVCATAFVQAGTVPASAWLAAAGVGALTTGILAVNNLRDRETDVNAGKHTLAVLLGRRGALTEYFLLLAVGAAAPVALVVLRLAGPVALLPLVSLPLFVRAGHGILTAADGPAFNRVLKATGQLVMVYGVLFAAGLALAAG